MIQYLFYKKKKWRKVGSLPGGHSSRPRSWDLNPEIVGAESEVIMTSPTSRHSYSLHLGPAPFTSCRDRQRPPEGACEHPSQPSRAPTSLGSKPQASRPAAEPCTTCPAPSLPFPLLLFPSLTLLQPHGPHCCSSSSPGSALPQGLCTAVPYAGNSLPVDIPVPCSLPLRVPSHSPSKVPPPS